MRSVGVAEPSGEVLKINLPGISVVSLLLKGVPSTSQAIVAAFSIPEPSEP